MIRTYLLLTLTLLISACGGTKTPDVVSGTAASSEEIQDSAAAADEPAQLTILSHDSFAISEIVLSAFELENNVEIILLPAGDTGAALNQAILSKEYPLADIFFGVDNTFLGRALKAEIFESYQSPALTNVSDELILDKSYKMLPVDFGYVCLNYDIAWLEEEGINPPASLADLTSPKYADLLVVENPGTSSPGLAFMLATIGVFGTSGEYAYLDFWADLRENGVLVTQGWEDAYFGHFSAASDGDRPIVVSYASSPSAEFIYADPPTNEPPTASVVEPDTCFRQVEFVGILKGTQERTLAKKFIDYMLGVPFQEDIPLNMFVFPANELAELPEEFSRWAAVPDLAVYLDPQEIEANRDKWIEEWTEVVLR